MKLTTKEKKLLVIGLNILHHNIIIDGQEEEYVLLEDIKKIREKVLNEK